jgi:predicted thioesterase
VSDINTAAEEFTGEWQQLTKTDHPTIEGRVTYFEKRPATYDGQPSLSRKTGVQRTEWVLGVQTDSGDNIKFSLMESGQRAIATAIKTNGKTANVPGDRIKIAVTEDSVQGKSQAEYKVKWTTDTAPLASSEVEDEEPF